MNMEAHRAGSKGATMGGGPPPRPAGSYRVVSGDLHGGGPRPCEHAEAQAQVLLGLRMHVHAARTDTTLECIWIWYILA